MTDLGPSLGVLARANPREWEGAELHYGIYL
jgi:hypothetical protein